MMKRFIVAIFLLIALPAPLYAISAISCHCFQDRSFDPMRPDAADAYYLATAQNRLMAAVFDQPRRSIVMAKQMGTSGEDLWIAYHAAAVSGQDHETLLDAKKAQGSWNSVLEKEGIDLNAPEMSPEELARQIVATTLAQTGLSDFSAVKALYADGAGSQEAILAVILSNALNQPAEQIWQRISRGEKSWGELLDTAGMTEELDASFARVISKS